jgi:3-oxoacyl-[acyl-carrier-protein] synthase-1
MSKVFITGMGIVSAIGNNVEETYESLIGRKSGISKIKYLQTSHADFPVGEVKLSNQEIKQMLDIPENVPTTRTALMGMLALREALTAADLPFPVANRSERIAFINGTTVGGMDKSEQFYLDFLENDTRNAYISTHDCGACTEMITDRFGIFSSVDTISTACSSAANAILLGAELLKNGRADVVVAGGSECITKFHLNGFNTLMILDKAQCRPFDATRAGLNLGEGAAYVVMETEERAKKRRAKPLCALSGYANTCDAFHQTASSPDGEGAYLAMKKALENADLQAQNIDYINAHGTGTDNNDASEGAAILRLFAEKTPSVSSTKSFTGHTTSAAGSVEAVISILALQRNFIPVNLNFSRKMAELTFAPAMDERPETPLQCVLSNSFGFGGNDTSLIFSTI